MPLAAPAPPYGVKATWNGAASFAERMARGRAAGNERHTTFEPSPITQ